MPESVASRNRVRSTPNATTSVKTGTANPEDRMLLAMVAVLGLLQQPEPKKIDIFKPGGRFMPEVGIPERNEEPGRIHRRISARGLISTLPVAPPPRPKVD